MTPTAFPSSHEFLLPPSLPHLHSILNFGAFFSPL
ncbi:uncharacterized protein N7479_006861 [Penicillium vulpinum]|nr:uncharacterized protein N7479_006861 [Penicillium vulpinum]KAJ5959711.1 hypothetical protein N7479_006861 [Penicillium vulpinum]